MRDRPGGVYIEIGIPDKKAKRLEEMHASGHRIANMCEEGLVYSDGRDYCNRKLGRSPMAWTDRLLVIGPRNAGDIRSHLPEFADKLVVTGNPRFDTLLSGLRCVYRRDADVLRKELGRLRSREHKLHAGQSLRRRGRAKRGSHWQSDQKGHDRERRP